MDENFLLDTETARRLYHEYAAEMPVFDYHCHLSAKEIYEDRNFKTITEAWLGGDHYKWRALRTNGVAEEYITGDAPDREKFDKWAETMPRLIGNPLYHWTHLELQRFFGIMEPLDEGSGERIYTLCNEKLQEKSMSPRNLVKNSNVFALCTTDDPADDLKYHKLLAEEGFDVKVLPGFRPDAAYQIQKETFPAYLEKLGNVCGMSIVNIKCLKEALAKRVKYFHEAGCRISDHGLDEILYLPCTEEEAEEILAKRLDGKELTKEETAKFQGHVQVFLGREYKKYDWAMQLHIGAMRDNNTRLFNSLGVNVGCDSIGDAPVAEPLSRLLDALDCTGELPRTILYCLNPRDNEVLAAMTGNFQGSEIPGKIQFGSGWWFNDQIDGMRRQLEALSQLGMLSRFVGMLTDSRSFLSYPRHEYFRRILCSHVGKLIESGQYPANMERVGGMVQDICFNNVKRYILGE